jgi:hypothetical protein
MVVGSILLPMAASDMPKGADQPNTESRGVVDEQPEPSADSRPPKLLYLAWQEDGIESTGKAIEHILWDTDGEIIELSEAREILQRVKSFDVHWRQEGGLHPLVLVFGIDEQLKAPAPLLASVIAPDGTRHSSGSAGNRPSGGMIVSAVAPEKRALEQWPSDVSLEVSYPLENLTTIRTVTRIPDEPIEVDPGVTWYIDGSRAVERNEATGETVRAESKVAAVLQKQREPEVLATYGARVYLRGHEEPVDEVYSTIIEPNGVLHEIRVSEAFGGKEEIERVEFVRQRRARHVYQNVPLHP